MKQLIILFSFLGSFLFAHSQVPQKNNTWYEFQMVIGDTLGIPTDTVPLPASLKSTRAFLGSKDSVIYIWSISKQKYVPAGTGTVSLNTTWGNITGTLSSQTDLQTALNAKVSTSTTLTINGVSQTLAANRTWGPFLVPSDTTWIHNQIIALYGLSGSGGTGGTGVTFQQALINGKVMSQDNDITGAYRIGFGTSLSPIAQFATYSSFANIISSSTSNVIQSGSGVNFLTSNSLVLEGTNSFKFSGIAQTTVIDTSTYKPVVIDGSGNIRQGYWFGGSSGGATPTLQQVLTAGSTLTTNNTIATGANTLTISTSTSGVNPLFVSSNNDYAIRGVSTNAVAISAQSTNDVAISAYSAASEGIVAITQPSSTNTVVPIMRLQRTSTGTPANGIGGSIDFNVTTNGGGDYTNKIESFWSNATNATRESQLNITGVNSTVPETFMNIQHGLVRINNNADTLATKADVRAGGGGGGGSTKFGKSGEDASASENRTFSTNAYSFLIDHNDGFGSEGQLSLHDGVTFLENSYVSSPDNQNAEVRLQGNFADYTSSDYTADILHKIHVASTDITFESKKPSDNSALTIKFVIKSLPTYADEAAATTGGMITGQVYKTSTGELRIKL